MKIEQLSQPKIMLGKKSMLAKKRVLLTGVAVSAMLILLGCASQSTQSSGMEPSAASGTSVAVEVAGEPRESAIQPVHPEITSPAVAEEEAGRSLPVRFQKPSYLIKDTSLAEDAADVDEELTLKVGADITTTAGPVTLRDIMKRLGSLHNMNVSWASDVDQYVYVDVDISANDDFFIAINSFFVYFNNEIIHPDRFCLVQKP